MNEVKVTGKQEFMGIDIPVVLGGFGEGKKCISDKTIAEIHNQPVPEIRKSIGRNIKRFKEDVDIIDLAQRSNAITTLDNERACDISTSENERIGEDDTLELLLSLGYAKQSITQAEHIYILSERGYAKLIKIMDTDLAWEVHDKLMDEYFELREYHKKLSPLEQLKLQQQAILEVDEKIEAVDKDLQRFKQDMPILGIEEAKIVSIVKRKGVRCLGGKASPAYKDSSLRGKVYSDIYGLLKRELGLPPNCTYKAIKRNQCELAMSIVEAYELPMALSNEIEAYNGFDDLLY